MEAVDSNKIGSEASLLDAIKPYTFCTTVLSYSPVLHIVLTAGMQTASADREKQAAPVHRPHSAPLSVSFIAILCITSSEMEALCYE